MLTDRRYQWDGLNSLRVTTIFIALIAYLNQASSLSWNRILTQKVFSITPVTASPVCLENSRSDPNEPLARFDLAKLKIFNMNIGEQRSVHVDCDTNPKIGDNCINKEILEMTCISLHPLVFLVPRLVSVDDCTHIRRRALRMGMSPSAYASTGVRISRTAWLSSDSVLRRIQERVSALTELPLSFLLQRSEDLQVVRYGIGGQFNAHHDSSADYFAARLMTTLVYLETSKIGEGGETWFPFAPASTASKSAAQQSDSQESQLHPLTVDIAVTDALGRFDMHSGDPQLLGGLSVTPTQGAALIFFNCLPSGVPDPAAVHAGLPVRVGEKWIANYWLGLDIASLSSSQQSESKPEY